MVSDFSWRVIYERINTLGYDTWWMATRRIHAFPPNRVEFEWLLNGLTPLNSTTLHTVCTWLWLNGFDRSLYKTGHPSSCCFAHDNFYWIFAWFFHQRKRIFRWSNTWTKSSYVFLYCCARSTQSEIESLSVRVRSCLRSRSREQINGKHERAHVQL